MGCLSRVDSHRAQFMGTQAFMTLGFMILVIVPRHLFLLLQSAPLGSLAVVSAVVVLGMVLEMAATPLSVAIRTIIPFLTVVRFPLAVITPLRW
jgi:hypothetical protein